MLAQHVQFKDEVMNQEQWYYADTQQQRHGPVTQSELQHLFAQGQLDLSSLIWCQGMEDWLPLQHFAMQFALQDPRGNPYTAPGASLIEPEAASSSNQQLQNYADFIGTNFDIYKRKWQLGTRSPCADGTWHWPGFLFGAYWMLYRKMYGVAAAWIAGVAIWSIVNLFLSVPNFVALLVGLGINIAAGVIANSLYLKHARRVIDDVVATHREKPQALRAELALRGGTSVGAVLIGLVMYVAFSFFLLLTLA